MASGTIMLARYTYKKNFNSYQVFLPDVDGLINGSPVRYMGIQIGYVNQVDIVGEEVYVKFVVTQKDFKLPKGSITTVEFTGLGGSKSLEIYPPRSPDKELSDKILIPQAPKRLNDAFGVLNDMFDKIIKITYDISSFMNEIGIIKKQEALKNSNQKISTVEMLDSADQWIDDAQKKRDKID
jgi:ABC-type transporter Mla subunit MlaD